MSTSKKKTTATAAKKSDASSTISAALASLKDANAKLPIDDAIPPNQMSATKVAQRVPLEAITIAAGVIADNPKSFPQFTSITDAVDYENAMSPVAQAALVLSSRIKKSILKRRTAAAHQTLALYQVMKGTSRLEANEETRTQVKQLGKLFTTKHKSRAEAVTQKETAVLVKTRKGAKKQAIAQAAADDASNQAAIVTAQAALDAAVAAGNVPEVSVSVPAQPAQAAQSSTTTVVVPATAAAGAAPGAATTTIVPSGH